MQRLTILASLLAGFCWCGSNCHAQDEAQRRTELGERQRLVERSMSELETRIVRVAETLQAKEPERAKRLIDALTQAKERLISRRMAEVTRLLDANRLDDAEKELGVVIDELEQLVGLLLNSDRDSMTKKQEIESLEKWKAEISQIRQEQGRQTKETQKIANKEQTLADLAAKIQQVQQLIAAQTELLKETGQQAGAGIRELDRLADKQFEIRQQTEEVARKLSDGQSPAAPAPPSPNSDNNPSGADTPSGNPPSGQNPNTPPSGQTPPADPNAPPPAESGAPAGKEPGQAPLENAMKNQQGAEEHLASGKSADAQREEQKAVDQLQRALDELEREKRRIASLPPEAFEQMAKEQRRTRGKTTDLADEMAKSKPSSDAQNDSADPNAKPKQPGQQQVEEAEQAMGNAAGGLEQSDAQAAGRQQKKAEEKLDEAMREIEERLSQLREETRLEKLARLEARFTEMLGRQRLVTQTTIELNDKQTSLNSLPRRDQLGLIRMAVEEMEINELGQQAYDLLIEDGTSSVFPECLQDVREDLTRVSQMLESERTDQLTQLVQREIESSLEDLLESLKQAQNEGGGGGGGGGGGKQPLLRKSAELKMLRAAQMRVNRLTRQFEMIREGKSLDDVLKNEIESIAQRQREIRNLAEEVMEKK